MPLLFVVSGPSGVGKSTLLRRLVRQVAGLSFVISHTTRPPRVAEKDGKDYHFVSDDEFDVLIGEGAFVEWAVVHDRRYGTSRSALEGDGDSDLLIEVDVQGAEALRAKIPGAVTVFIQPPEFADLESRLADRGRDPAPEVERRLETAREEIGRADHYDYRIVNDDRDEAVRDLARLIERIREGGAP